MTFKPHLYGSSRPQFNEALYIITPYLSLAVFLAVHPRPSLLARISVWMGLLAFLLSGTFYDAGSDFDNWGVGMVLLGPSFTAFVLMFLWNPVHECRHEDQKQGDEIKDMPFWRRAYYMLCVIVTYRGVGWNYQIPHLPPRRTMSRPYFLFARALHLLWHILILDAGQTYLSLNPLFSASGNHARSMRSQGPLLLSLNVAAYMSLTYCTLNIWNDTASLIAVGLGLGKPDQWPVVFGRWRDAYTVRRFWSRTWHQTFRRFISEISKWVSRSLNLIPGSWASSHVQLVVGFALSGLAHVPGDFMLSPYTPYPFLGKSFPFFIYQAALIALEDFLISFGKTMGVNENKWTKTLGYIWTAGWLVWSTPLFNDWHLVAGMGKHRVFELGMIEWCLKSVGVWDHARLMLS